MFPSKSQHRPEVLTVSQGARALRRGAVLRDSLSQVVSWFGSNSWRRLGAGLWASLVKMFFPLCLQSLALALAAFAVQYAGAALEFHIVLHAVRRLDRNTKNKTPWPSLAMSRMFREK